jgi:hypothetical protein
MQLEVLLSKLDNVRRSGHGWSARCPAHEDRHSSFSITPAEDGKILLKCFAGCPVEEVLARLGLAWADLFPEPHSGNGRNGHSKRRIDRVYDYRDENGGLLYQNVRFLPKDFRLRKPDGNGGWDWSLNGSRRVPYRLPQLIEAVTSGKTVFIVEGEKDADRLSELGLTATTSGGAKSWREEFAEFFRGASVVIIPDRDRPGEEYARIAAQSLQGKAASVRILLLPLPWREKNGLDVSDWLLEHSAHDLLQLVQNASEPQALSSVWDTAAEPLHGTAGTTRHPSASADFGNSDELLSKQLDPVRWVVPGLLTEGLWLFCGKPKMGKSWLALSLCVATATGGVALGKIRVEPGDVLYLPLEDNERRFKSRLEKLLSGEPVRPSLKRLSYLLECPRLDQGGLERIEAWLKAHPGAKLIVIDTLARIRPLPGRIRTLYDEDYGAVQGLKGLADRYQITILVIHHLRKATAEDVQDTINATTGLAGGVDGTLILQRVRGHSSASLHIDGRDTPDVKELAINWDQLTAQWTLMGDAEEFRVSQMQNAVVAALREARLPLGPTELLAVLREKEPNLTMNALKVRLFRMTKASVLQSVGRGRYWLPGDDSDPNTQKGQ